jgi:2'-5' RNA ligase
MMRCFVAIGTCEEVRRRLLSVQQRLSPLLNWKPVEFENMHLTLKFLGEVEDTRSGEILSALRSACSSFSRFEISVKGIGAFPGPSYVRVLWAGISEGAEKVVSISKAIDSELAKLGFPRERDFVPHVTIGRVKFVPRRKELMEMMESLKGEEFGRSEVESVELMKSVLTPKGPLYNSVGQAVLSGP